MLPLAGALLLHAVLIAWRDARFQEPVDLTARPYFTLFAACLATDLLATYGFFVLFRSQPVPSRFHNDVLTGLSLIAGAAIVVKFALSRSGSEARRRMIETLSSIGLVAASYMLFGFIAYYSRLLPNGERPDFGDAWLPAIMLALLWVNTFYDHWDHAEGGE